MAPCARPSHSDVRPELVERVRARLAGGERTDPEVVALAILAWTCRPPSPAS